MTFETDAFPPFAVDIRTRLHRQLGLPLDRPLLRSANALSFDDTQSGSAEASTSGRLLDVHVGIRPSGGGIPDTSATCSECFIFFGSACFRSAEASSTFRAGRQRSHLVEHVDSASKIHLILSSLSLDNTVHLSEGRIPTLAEAYGHRLRGCSCARSSSGVIFTQHSCPAIDEVPAYKSMQRKQLRVTRSVATNPAFVSSCSRPRQAQPHPRLV